MQTRAELQLDLEHWILSTLLMWIVVARTLVNANTAENKYKDLNNDPGRRKKRFYEMNRMFLQA
jgi:hypothetical protein